MKSKARVILAFVSVSSFLRKNMPKNTKITKYINNKVPNSTNPELLNI